MNKIKKSKMLFSLLFIAYAAIYIGRKNFSVLMAGMLADGIIDKLTGGTAATAFLAVYACGQFINGMLGDRVSPKLMISAGLAGAGAANAAMGLVTGPAAVPVIWGACGFFCSMLWPPVVRCISEYIPEDRRPAAGVNISVTLPAGAMASYLLCAAMTRFFGWREAFFACAAILFAACAVFLSGFGAIGDYIRETDETSRRRPAKTGEGRTADGDLPGPFRMFIICGLLWVTGGILFNGILKDGLDMWVPTCITEYFGMPVPVSSLLSGIMPVVNLAGAFAAQRLNGRYFRNEMKTAAAMFGVSMASFVPLLAVIHYGRGGGIAAASAAILLISVTSSSMLGVNTMLITLIPFRFGPVGRSSGVTGFLNAFLYAAASLSGVTTGYISVRYGWAATILAFAVCSACGTAVCAAGVRSWKKGSAWLSQRGGA